MKTPEPKYSQMERARAAVYLLNNSNSLSGKRVHAFAFLSILHPNIPLARRLRLAHDIAEGPGKMKKARRRKR